MNSRPRQFSSPPRSLADLLAGVPSDAELVARYVATREETAFELLLRRHAALVLGVCRRLLPDANDADDAFQATFLVLARKAGSISRRESIAAWLHQIARRAALRIRASRVRHSCRERAGVDGLAAPSIPTSDQRELYRVLDEEVGRLPAHHRSAFVLCCLEGKTGEEAAQLLGCPPGTVSSRLTRAREQLRARLVRRGFAPAGLGTLALLSDSLATPSAALVNTTLSTTLAFAPGGPFPLPPSRPAIIAQGVIRTMALNKLRFAPLVLVGLLVAGVVLVETGTGAGPEQRPPEKKANDTAKTEPGPPTVQVIRAKPGGLDRIAGVAFNAEAVQQSDLYPAADGTLKLVSVNLGDRVKAGQILAEIDSPELMLMDRQAKVALVQAESLLKEAQGGVATAQADVVSAQGKVKQREAEAITAQSALNLRKRQFERMKSLSDKNAVDSKALDEIEDQVRSATGQVDAATSGIETAKADVEVKKAKVVQAEAAVGTAKANVDAARFGLERAQLAVGHTRMVAPFDGMVTRCTMSVGDVVRTGELRSKPLLTIMRADIIRLSVEVPDTYALLLRPGIPAEITFDAIPDFREKSKVARVGFAVESRSRTIRAEIDMSNPKGDIRPGMAGAARIRLGGAPVGAVRVPMSALFRIGRPRADGVTQGVYVYRDGKARLTQVFSNYSEDNEAEVTSGLKADDLVVVDPSGLAGDEVPVRAETKGPTK